MAAMRKQSRPTSMAQPPSPIPTAKGSRSAAINDQILSDYLQKSLQIPNLSLPDSHFPSTAHQLFPAKIEYKSLVSRGSGSINQLLKSASKFDMFLISGHGISAEELRSVAAEAERISQFSEGREIKFRRNGIREEFVWFDSEWERSEWARDRTLSQQMESIESKLDEIAKELAQVLSECTDDRIQDRESIISLRKYNNDNLIGRDWSLLDNNNSNFKSCGHALSLHIPLKHCEYFLQLETGPLSFDAGPDTIVVNVGPHHEDWSLGELKSASGEVILKPEIHGSRASFSIEFRSSPSIPNYKLKVNNKTISIADQILIALVLTFLYIFYAFIYSFF